MNSPFQFGGIVSGNNFTNRIDDIDRLLTNFDNDINTLLLSPRRWGKSSLIQKAAKIASSKNKGYKFCFIDLFNIRDEDEFYSVFVRELIKVTSSRSEEWIKNARLFLKRIAPKITIGIDPQTDFNIKFDLDIIQNSYSEILNLPDKIAKDKKIKIIVCIDEFQNLGNFNNPLLFQKRLRANWQHHKNTVYCLYGSKRHMLMELFENKSMPFYKFGDTFYLDKISKKDLSIYISNQFKKTNKEIDQKLVEKIIYLMKRHPYYVQHLSYIVWINTAGKVTDRIFNNSVEDLLNQNSLLFEKEVENLSNAQLNFLKAIANNVKTGFSSSKTIKEYNLGTSGNVVKIKKTLRKKEIIDIIKNEPIILDPAFELWLKEVYFHV